MEESQYRLKIGPQEIVLHFGETVVGRSEECSLCLDDERLSRAHAKFIATESQIGVVDLGSRNGTYVNDVRVRNPLRLNDGDQVRVGQTLMILSIVGRRTRRSSTTGRTLGGATLVDMSPPGGEESDVLYRVLQLGRLDEAEKLLKARVANIVRSDPPLPVDHILSRNVQGGMMTMADKSMDPRWIHRLFKLHVTCQWFMTEETQKRVEQLIRAIGRAGGDGLPTYLTHWASRSKGLSQSRQFRLARLNDLANRDSQLWSDK
jgi:pSer/pThr/pTyr-binding forkhead associated (FHA) protein